MKNKKSFQFNLAALLVLIMVVLVFSFQGYIASGPVTLVSKIINLPASGSQVQSSPGIQVQVSGYQIWVEDKEVLNTKTARMNKVFGDDGKRINPLFEELVSIRKRIQEARKLSPKAREFSGVANLIIDKSLKYNYLKRIMYTCAAAGFKEVKFVVSGKSR